ncbi:MAG: ribose 5-phosphate isomerase B [bacterium]
MKISLGSDHGGFALKDALKSALELAGYDMTDRGCFSREAVDYPDLARTVAEDVTSGRADRGVLVCRSGMGMSMAANKLAGIRAALCVDQEMARLSREHNDANVLVLGGDRTPLDEALRIVKIWMTTAFSGDKRHQRRIEKMTCGLAGGDALAALDVTDADVASAVRREEVRETRTIDLIASENYASRAVREAQGSVMTNKYAEGYPGKRYYSGCECVDEVERLAIERARALFGAEHANVQPHCGTSANMAVYFTLLKPGDKVLAMSLAHGGHLTHGSKVNFSGRLFDVVPYGVATGSEMIDYGALAKQARDCQPKLIVAGARAYPGGFDFPPLRAIADEVGAKLMVDMAHIAGLVAAGLHPSPVPHADFVTTTTHKTLRGPRGGMVLCRAAYAEALDKQVFPGMQGGPLMHVVAAKAVCFHEAMQPSFKNYARQILVNARTLADFFASCGARLVSGGTDNHLLLVDVTSLGATGKEASTALEACGIVVNKNAIPFDPHPPAIASGIRIGTPAVTTRGMGVDEMLKIGGWIVEAIRKRGDPAALAAIREQAMALAVRFPVP